MRSRVSWVQHWRSFGTCNQRFFIGCFNFDVWYVSSSNMRYVWWFLTRILIFDVFKNIWQTVSWLCKHIGVGLNHYWHVEELKANVFKFLLNCNCIWIFSQNFNADYQLTAKQGADTLAFVSLVRNKLYPAIVSCTFYVIILNGSYVVSLMLLPMHQNCPEIMYITLENCKFVDIQLPHWCPPFGENLTKNT